MADFVCVFSIFLLCYPESQPSLGLRLREGGQRRCGEQLALITATPARFK